MTDHLTRRVTFLPGYDRRHPNPSLDGGVHGMEIRFVLSGPKGAVTFLLYTDWLPEATAREYQQTHPAPVRPYQAYPADVGYHAYVPQYPDQPPIPHCPFLNGCDCYSEGSGLDAEPIYWAFVQEGEEALWRRLEAWYDRMVGPEEVSHAQSR